MIEHLFTWLTLAMNDRFEIAILAAIGWGVTSIILSPCHLSSIPLVIGYLTSQGPEGIKRPFSLSFVFATGILITIALIGALTASAGRMLGDVGVWGNIVVSGVFFVVGLYLMDLIKLPWNGIIPQSNPCPRLDRCLAVGSHLRHRARSVHVCLYGAGARRGVYRCDRSPIPGAWLIAAFGIGHCAVIVGAGGAAGTVQKYLNWTNRSRSALLLKRGAGILVMLGGVYYIYTAI